MKKLSLKKIGSVVFTVLLLAVITISLGLTSQGDAQEPKQFDLNNFTLEVNEVKYTRSPAEFSDDVPFEIFEVVLTITNKAGEAVSFIPQGELTFLGASGKEYLIPNVEPDKLLPFNLKVLEGNHALVKEIYKKKGVDNYRGLPQGIYKWGFGTPIDRGDKIVSIIYRNGKVEKPLDISEIVPIIDEVIPSNDLEH